MLANCHWELDYSSMLPMVWDGFFSAAAVSPVAHRAACREARLRCNCKCVLGILESQDKKSEMPMKS